jgi:hypothetical protein
MMCDGQASLVVVANSKSAQSSAVLYSIVASVKANGLTQYNYISHLLEQFSQPEPDVEERLPWNVSLD